MGSREKKLGELGLAPLSWRVANALKHAHTRMPKLVVVGQMVCFKNCAFVFLQYFLFLSIDFNILPLQSEVISAHIWNKIFHLTLTTLPHNLTKLCQ